MLSCYKPFFNHKLVVNVSCGARYTDYSMKSAVKELALNNDNRGWAFVSNVDITYMAPKNWFFTGMLSYNSRQRTLTTTTVQRPLTNLSVSKSFNKDRMSLELNWSDVGGMWGRHHVDYNFKGHTQTRWNNFHTSRITLVFVYHLGGYFQARRLTGNIENDDITTK